MLIFCKECHAEVSESAPVCPKCGVPNPAGCNCQISISRKWTLGGISIIEIYIDEKMVGSIKNGETINLDLAPGEHEVVAVCVNLAGPVITRGSKFEVYGEQAVEFECGISGWSGFFFKQV
jgi:hypothetical protein